MLFCGPKLPCRSQETSRAVSLSLHLEPTACHERSREASLDLHIRVLLASVRIELLLPVYTPNHLLALVSIKCSLLPSLRWSSGKRLL